MPVLRINKRTKKTGGINRKEAHRKSVADIAEIISDTGQDWKLTEIVDEMRRRGKFPPFIYDNAARQAEKKWTKGCLREKTNVGTRERPKWIRVNGAYVVYETDENGKETQRWAWRAWEVMGRAEGMVALRCLFKIARSQYREAKNTLEYFNKLLSDRGLKPFLLEEVKSIG